MWSKYHTELRVYAAPETIGHYRVEVFEGGRWFSVWRTCMIGDYCTWHPRISDDAWYLLSHQTAD